MSLGMSAIKEIDRAVKIIKAANNDFTLLHCVSVYPTPVKECNLKAIPALRKRYHCRVGWSDHTVNPAVLYRAVHQFDASMIEFHLDIDKKGAEYKQGHNWLPQDIRKVIDYINQGFDADGIGVKKPTLMEKNSDEILWRADPVDGLRPLKKYRKKMIKNLKL